MNAYQMKLEATQDDFKRTMTYARILRLFIGTRAAARVFNLRAHWIRSARECGWSKI